MVEWNEATDSKLHKDVNKTSIHRRPIIRSCYFFKSCREATVQGRILAVDIQVLRLAKESQETHDQCSCISQIILLSQQMQDKKETGKKKIFLQFIKFEKKKSKH